MIKVQKLCPGDLPKPSQAKWGDAGYDLRADIHWKMNPGDLSSITTGYCWEIPIGYVGLIRPRSGLSVRGIDTRAGVIDSSFRGVVVVLLKNESHEPFHIEYGDRIAQMVVVPHWMGGVIEVDDLTQSERGSGGFGSTGIK